jgi:hypothetical protein
MVAFLPKMRRPRFDSQLDSSSTAIYVTVLKVVYVLLISFCTYFLPPFILTIKNERGATVSQREKVKIRKYFSTVKLYILSLCCKYARNAAKPVTLSDVFCNVNQAAFLAREKNAEC